MSLLTLVQNASTRIGQPRPSIVIGATDPTTQQMLSLANEEGIELMKWGDWRKLRRTLLWTTLNQEEQTGMIPSDLGQWIDESQWNRSARRPIWGPVSPQTWQAWKAFDTFPVMDTFYMEGDNVLVQPIPPAGETYAFAYTSNHWCQSAALVGQDQWLADTDTGILSERIMTLGLIWRYKQARSLPFEADYQLYELQVKQELAQDSPRSTHSMAGGGEWWARRPGIVIPPMNWNV